MSFSPSIHSVRAFLAGHAPWLAFLPFCLLCAGCFWPRDYTPWSDPNASAGQHAILPVLPAQVRITLDDSRDNGPYEISLGSSNVKNHEQVARIVNKVLDTIAAGENNVFLGPSKIDSLLKQIPGWKNLEVYLQDPGPLDEGWKQEGLATISTRLGRSRVLRVNPTLRFKPDLLPDAGKNKNDPPNEDILWEKKEDTLWEGKVTVNVDNIDLQTAQVVASGAGEADFYGRVGIVVFGGYTATIMIPYAYRKAFDRAVDQAVRKALTDLFNLSPKKGALQ